MSTGGICLVLALVLGLGAARAERQTSRAPVRPVITHGVASGDVSASTALIWARANSPARMHVQLSRSPRFTVRARERTASATSSSDFTAKVRLTRLRPNTRYFYRVWFSRKSQASSKFVGSLRTAPAASTSAPVSFVTSGDLGGQGYCRNVNQRGYGILTQMARLAPDAFIANGDMIYADDECPSAGPPGWQNVPGRFSSVANPALDWRSSDGIRRVYLAHWRYNRADIQFRRLLRETLLYSLWDDHEVLNDFGAAWPQYPADPTRLGYPNLVRQARRAFFLYGLIDGGRIYRSFRWGKDVELFILDCRSYRSLNTLADTAENAKTMLGAAQRTWLLERLRRSTATWKLVVTGSSLAIASGQDQARDGWADGHSRDLPTSTGFERELRALLTDLDRANVRNLVFLAGDVHHARELRYDGDYDGDGERLLFHEVITGPLAADRNVVRALDPTFGPTPLYEEGDIFNFGYVRVRVASNRTAHLLADVRDENGAVRPGSALDLAPE
jgi:alkaline phosphatase D